MKVYLLHQDRDFDFGPGLPFGHEDLIQDLELNTLLQAMAAGDKFLSGVAAKVLLASLHDPEAIRYRQRVLADCLDQPEVIREMYAVAVGVLADKRRLWGYGGTYQTPSSNLSGAVAYLEAYVARLRQLRKIADDHGAKFRSDGLRTLFATLQRELDDEYFEEISDHLKQLRFRAGVLISAELDRDNSGIGFVLRAGDARRRRQAQRRHPRAGVGQQRVDVTVVAAGELDDLGATGESAGQSHRAHGGLGAGVDQPDQVNRRHPVDDLRGQFGFGGGRGPERQAGGGGFGDGFHHRRVRVSEDHRSPRADQVDVAVAVGVGEPVAAGLGDEPGGAADRLERPHRRVHPARNDRAGVVEQLRRDLGMHVLQCPSRWE